MNTAYLDASTETLSASYRRIRRASEQLCAQLEIEDYGLQAMPEVSPPKWHLAHTSWFFETFILKPFAAQYQPFDVQYEYLFNSYYNAIGKQYPRSQRALLSRPTVKEVYAYRHYVDRAMHVLLDTDKHPQADTIVQRCELGLQHEQQHQELLCTDIKYSFSLNPLLPALNNQPPPSSQNRPGELTFTAFDSSDTDIGFSGPGFHFDNESPAHQVHLPAFSLANRLVSNAEYLDFISDGGYQRAELWLADGWAWKQENAVELPLYWLEKNNDWYQYSLYGLLPLDLCAPVSHVNYYEAEACARWMNRRLPREQEWEAACRQLDQAPAHSAVRLQPESAGHDKNHLQFFGALWQWTQSNYAAYPGYRQASGAIGEYNGKFMCNQMVLRGSSCVTPPGHARISYRNFFYARDRWQFSGIRLADDC